MAADGISPALAIRSSVGVELWHSTGQTYATNENFSRDESKFCRAIEFSPDGRYLAWANGTRVQIAEVNSWNIICSLPRPKTFAIKFSPKGTYLATLEHFSTPKDGSPPQPNFCVYQTNTGDVVYSIINKNFPDDWMPGWSSDESLFGLMVGGEALFFETTDPTGYTKVAKKIGGSRGGELSIAGAGNNPHVALYVPGVKGQPNIVKIFRYPALDAPQVVASKSFYQADRVEMMWNKKATAMILMTSTEVDSTGASYYGKQALHFLNIKGDSCSVPLSKDGPIHAVQWNPKGNEFCVIYGYMPSKATFFNLKCDAIFEVNEGPRNSIYYNSFGNIVLLAGFGNLRGNVEVWDSSQKKLITTFQAPDSTLLEWGPDGETILTATTAPRLRIGNGFKVWHYSGSLLHESMWPTGQELLQVIWQRYADGTFTEKAISNVKVQGIQSSQPETSNSRYVPPHCRGGNVLPLPTRANVSAINNATPSERSAIPGLPIGYKTSQGLRKKERDAKRSLQHKARVEANNIKPSSNDPNAVQTAQQPSGHPQQHGNLSENQNNRRRNRPQQNNNQNQVNATNGSPPNHQINPPNSLPTNQNDNNVNNDGSDPNENNSDKPSSRSRRRNNRNKEAPVVVSTGDPEKDKQIRARIRVIQQKLRDIVKLKAKRDNGDGIDANQLSKIKTEEDLVRELNALKVSA